MRGEACQHRHRQIAVHTDGSLRNYETLYCEKCFEIAGRFAGESSIERPSRFFPFHTDPKQRLRVVIVFPEVYRSGADALIGRIAAESNVHPFGLNTIDRDIDAGGVQMLRTAIPNADLALFLSTPLNLPDVLKEVAPPGSKPIVIVREDENLRTRELLLLNRGYMVIAPSTVDALQLLIKGYAPSIIYDAPTGLIHNAPFKIEMASLSQQMALALENDADALRKLAPRKFEELIAELMERAGYEVELTQSSHDGGVDIFAIKSNEFGRILTIVDCKRYGKKQTIGPQIVRTMVGTLDIHSASHGMIATTTTFTSGAREIEKQMEFRLSLKDHSDVAAWIHQHCAQL